MPRDSSGVYTLPAGNPVVTGTIITSSWANTTTADLAAQMNNVFTRDGLLGPTAAFKIQDGTVVAPGIAFNSEPGLGFYRDRARIVGMAVAGSSLFSFDGSTNNTFLYLFPRVAGEASAIFHNQPAGVTNTSRMHLGVSSAGHGFLYAEGIGGAAKPNMYFDANAFVFSGGGINTQAISAASVSVAGGASITQDANWSYLSMGPGWYFNWSKVSGELQWNGPGTGSFRFVPNGDFSAGRDVYCGGGNMAMLGSQLSLRYTADGWRLIYSNGGIHWQAPGGQTKVVIGVSGSGTVYSEGGEFQTSGNIATRFTAGYYNQYIALGDPNLGDQGQLSFNHDPGVWAGLLFRIGSAAFQFDRGGNPRCNVGGPWQALVSDVRVKERIEDYTEGLAEILALRPRVFSFRPETGMDATRRHISLIAQEALEAMPRIVQSATIRELGEVKHDDFLTLDTGPITFALVNAMKELHDRITHLESQAE